MEFRLFEYASTVHSADRGTKPPDYYLRYDKAFAAKKFVPQRIFEVGVHQGESTKVFSAVYPDAKIVAVDIKVYDIDFSEYPMVTYLQADQSNKETMSSIIAEHFPHGIDLVIDDASHIGSLSRMTFDIVFPHVRSGGIYIVEDWGTGYWDTWPDGGRFQEYPLNFHDGNLPKRLPSHDFGMVGFVKSLVDYTSEPDIRLNESAPVTRASRIKSLEFSPGICIAEKA